MERTSASGDVMEKDREITPYRMGQIMKTAAHVTEMIVSGKTLYHPTYDECEMVVALVAEALKKGKEEYRRKQDVLK